MLRSILNGSWRTISCSRLMSSQQISRNFDQSRLVKERLFVELCGQISQPPIKLEKGNIVFQLRTRNGHDDFYAAHQVILPTSIARNIPDGCLKEGERVFVTGVIFYKEFQCAGDRYRTKRHGQILSNNLILCKPCEDPASDINDIILYGHVKHTPSITEHITFLRVNTKFFDAKSQEYKFNLHDVMIMNDNNMRDQANHLDIGTRLSIHGSLKTQFVHNDKGKTRGIYYIRPRRLIVHQPTESYNRPDTVSEII